MPYKVVKSGKGYKVKNKRSGKTYSKKSMSKAKAKRQMAAMYANTNENNEAETSQFEKPSQFEKLIEVDDWDRPPVPGDRANPEGRPELPEPIVGQHGLEWDTSNPREMVCAVDDDDINSVRTDHIGIGATAYYGPTNGPKIKIAIALRRFMQTGGFETVCDDYGFHANYSVFIEVCICHPGGKWMKRLYDDNPDYRDVITSLYLSNFTNFQKVFDYFGGMDELARLIRRDF